MPEVTQRENHPELHEAESSSPEIEALPGAGDDVIFVEEDNEIGRAHV